MEGNSFTSFRHRHLFVLKRAFRHFWEGEGRVKKSLHSGQVAHQAGAYPGFRSMKRLRVFLLPPGWDASPSQGYPPTLNSPVPIYTPGWREAP